MKSAKERILSAARILSYAICLGYLGDQDEVMERFQRDGGTIDWLFEGLNAAKLLHMKKVSVRVSLYLCLSVCICFPFSLLTYFFFPFSFLRLC